MSANPTGSAQKAFREISAELFASPAVSSEEAERIKGSLEELGKKSADKVVAKYKLEVMFGTQHTVQGNAYGVLTIWSNGTKLHGGGDSLLYVCPGKMARRNECDAIIPDGALGLSVVACPHCGVLWKSQELISEHFYRLPIQRWADVMVYWMAKTMMDADLRIKYNYKYKNMDIRSASAREQERQLKGDILGRIREPDRRPAKIYPLANLIKDTSAGADLYTRVLAFMRS